MSSGEAVSAQEAAPERARGGPWAPAAPREARGWRRPGDAKFFNVRHPEIGSEPTFGSCTTTTITSSGSCLFSSASSPRGPSEVEVGLQRTPPDSFLSRQPPAQRHRVCAPWSHGGPERQRPGQKQASRAAGPGSTETCPGTGKCGARGLPPFPGSSPSTRGPGSPFEASLGGGSQGPGHPAACRDARRPPGPRGGPIPGSPDDARP